MKWLAARIEGRVPDGLTERLWIVDLAETRFPFSFLVALQNTQESRVHDLSAEIGELRTDISQQCLLSLPAVSHRQISCFDAPSENHGRWRFRGVRR